MIKFFLKNTLLGLLIVVLIFLFRPWLTFSEVLCKGDCIYFFPENLEGFFAPPYFWNTSPSGSGLGFYALPTIAFSPPSILLGFFHHFFQLNFEIIEKIAWFFPFLVFSFLGMVRLGKVLGLNSVGIFFAVLLYLTNSYILLTLDGGQIGIALAYSLLPIVFSFFLTGVEGKKPKDKLIAATLLGILSFFDLRVSYLIYFLLFSYLLFHLLIKRDFQRHTLMNIISSLALILIIPFSFHFYWIIPLALSKMAGLPSFYTEVSQVAFLSWMNFSNAIYLFHPYWSDNIFGKTNPVSWQFFIIPFLAFLNLLLKVKNKIIFYLIFISLLAILLLNGANKPFGDLYLWLFKNLPGFYMFRDPSKFYILLSLSFSLLIGFSADAISHKIKGFKWTTIAFFSFLLFWFLLLIKPVLFQEMKGTFKPLSLPKEFLAIKDKVSRETEFSRSIWYPNKPEFAYSSPLHPVLDASYDLLHKRPFDIAISGTYDMFSYLENPFSRQLFDILGIKYVFASNSLKNRPASESEIKDKERLLKVLNQTTWLKKNSTEQIASFKTQTLADHFFMTNNNFWVVGSDSLYQILDSFSGFQLRQLGLVYLDELGSFPDYRGWQKQDYLVFNNKDWSNLIFDLADKRYFISPARAVAEKTLPDKSWIVKGPFDFLSWRDTLARRGFGNLDFDFGGGFVFADDYPQTLTFNFDLAQRRKGDLYLRYFSNRLGGKFMVKLDNKQVGSLKTISLRDNFVWEKLDSLELKEGKHTITLANLKGFNAVNVFAFLPEGEIQSWQQQAQEIVAKNKIISFYEPGEATKSGGINFAKSGQFEILTQVPAYFKNLRLQIKVGGQTLASMVKTNLDHSEWYSFGKINLKEGFNEVEIPPQVGEIIFFQTDRKGFKELLAGQSTLPTITYQFINPTKYLLTVQNSKAPFTLIFSESYHPLWEAKIDNQTFQPIPVYSIINEFNIPRTGDFKMVVEFSPQRMFWPAFLVSIISFLLTGSVLLFFIRNEKNN